MKIFQCLFNRVAPQPLPADAVLIDVRSPAEFGGGHVQGAHSLPLERLAHDLGRIAPDTSAPLILYCRSGARSGAALRQLQALGYTQAVNGGSVEAVAASLGRPVVRG